MCHGYGIKDTIIYQGIYSIWKNTTAIPRGVVLQLLPWQSSKRLWDLFIKTAASKIWAKILRSANILSMRTLFLNFCKINFLEIRFGVWNIMNKIRHSVRSPDESLGRSVSNSDHEFIPRYIPVPESTNSSPSARWLHGLLGNDAISGYQCYSLLMINCHWRPCGLIDYIVGSKSPAI